MGFSRSNRIGALLIALQPDLAQGAVLLTGKGRTTLERLFESQMDCSQWRIWACCELFHFCCVCFLYVNASPVCSPDCIVSHLYWQCCDFPPFWLWPLLLLPTCRCVRTRERLSHAGQVTSSALSNMGVVITRRLAEMRYPHDWPGSYFLVSEMIKV